MNGMEWNYQIKTKLERLEKRKPTNTWASNTDTTKQVEMKEKIKKENIRRTSKLIKTKLYSKNLIKGINPWAAR